MARVVCPQCTHEINVDDDRIGQQLTCPTCKQPFMPKGQPINDLWTTPKGVDFWTIGQAVGGMLLAFGLCSAGAAPLGIILFVIVVILFAGKVLRR